MNIDFNTLTTAFGVWSVLPLLATLLVHIAFSAAVFNDARKRKARREEIVFAGPLIWSIAVLVGGVLAALFYWIIHHSALRRH